jgi:hypothetical protein
LNYRIHTDAVKAHLIPPEVTPAQAATTYANEADILNVALFGKTAKQWRAANPNTEGNMRDHASVEQLLVLANIEGMNAEFIHMKLQQGERLQRLNQIAIRQMLADWQTPLAAWDEPGLKPCQTKPFAVFSMSNPDRESHGRQPRWSPAARQCSRCREDHPMGNRSLTPQPAPNCVFATPKFIFAIQGRHCEVGRDMLLKLGQRPRTMRPGQLHPFYDF